MSIGITAATGHLGRLVVSQLKSKVPADRLVALVRNPAKAVELGVPIRAFDYSEPAGLSDALAGVETLLLISGSEVGQRVAQHRNVIEAAKTAGVRRIVYTSLLRADTSPLSLAGEHIATEEALKASGVPFTILRNGWYSENYTGAIPGALAGGAFVGSAGEGRISGATRADYAAAAVEAVIGEDHENATYELAGDDAWTLSDLAAEVSRQTGKTIAYRDLSEAEYARTLEGYGLPAPLAASIAGWDVGASQGALQDEGHALSRLIGRPTTPLATAVADALKAL